MSPVEFFNRGIFIKKLVSLEPSHRYSILFRVCFGSHPSYKMLGNQIGLCYTDSQDIDFLYISLHDNLLLRLESSMINYNFNDDDIITIQLLAYKVVYTNDIQKSIKPLLTLDNLGHNKDLVESNKTKIDSVFSRVLPPNMDLSKYGNPIQVINKSINDNTKIILFNRKEMALESLMTQTGNIVLHPDTKVFSNNDKYLITVRFPSDKAQHNIDVFTRDGRHALSIVDNAITNTIFTRTTSNITKTIDVRHRTVFTTVKVNFDNIKQPKSVYSLKDLNIPNPRIGSLDLETYTTDGISKVYALGFYTKSGIETFYINEKLDSSELVLRCIDSMLVAKYSGITFYVHNLGRYDIVFLLKILINANVEQEKYKLDIYTKNDLILSLKIKVNGHWIKLVDSYNILSHSLKDLGKTFELDTKKDIFPYKFVNRNTIFYCGNVPDKRNYNDDVDKDTYNSIPKVNWSTQAETVKYLERDLKSLLEVIGKFSDYVYRNHRVQVSGSLTISSLAMKIFLTRFYANNIPLINKRSVYEDIKKSYFGGITEVYKPYGKDLYYYDVNSLYPYAALNSMPGSHCVFEDSINSELKDINKLFGFYYCTIETEDNYLGLLPVRSKQGIIMPNGRWTGWYFSAELDFASCNGYNIYVHKGYTFSKEHNVFDKYVEHFYKIKSNTNSKVEKAISKSLLNNLLGRFGLDIHKSKTDLMDVTEYNDISQSKAINSVTHIEDKMLVNYNNKVSKTICDELNVDYKNTVLVNQKSNNESEKTFADVSIAIASAVTSYARITISKAKLNVLKKGGELYYSDTDSIVTNVPFDDDVVGNKLGQYKLEHTINRAYFISSKTYCLILKFGTPLIKAKGVNNHKLNENDFIDLYKGLNVETVRSESHKDFSQGYVNINVVRTIILNGDAYTKRTKIFVDNVWRDTKPLVIANTDDPGKVENSKKISKNPPHISGGMLYNTIIYGLFMTSMLFYVIGKHLYNETDDSLPSDNSSQSDSPPDDCPTQRDNLQVRNTHDNFKIDNTFYKLKPPVRIIKNSYSAEEPEYSDLSIDPTIQCEDDTLYQNFVKDVNSLENNSSVNRFVDSTTTTVNELSPIKDNSLILSPDKEKSTPFTPFTPGTYECLQHEIEKNEKNTDDLNNICKDADIKDSIKEKLIDERVYYLDQQNKHMDSVLEEAKNVSLNDVDTDKLIKHVDNLKVNVDKLHKDSQSIKHRSLERSNTSSMSESEDFPNNK